jgi:uncharacterized protein
MKSTYDKICELPPAQWDWDPEDPAYAEFSPNEQNELIPLIYEEHLEGLNEEQISEAVESAGIHAYRILASFLDPTHIPLFIELLFDPAFEGHDLYFEDIIQILPRYGSDAVQPCIQTINRYKLHETSRMYLCDILITLASKGIQSELIFKNFIDYLSAKHFTRELNSYIILLLPESEKLKHLEVIRRSFKDHLVDLSMAGDFEEFEIQLGLRKERTTPCSNFFEAEEKERILSLKKLLGPRPSQNDPSSLLTYILEFYGIERGITTPSSIDGYLTAILLNPTQQTPADFIPPIWDSRKEYTPNWDHPDDADFFKNFILAVQKKIIKDLKRRKINPFLDIKDQCPYTPWIQGFLKGFDAWDGFIPDSEDPENLTELEDVVISNILKILTEEIIAKENNTHPKTVAHIKKLNSAIYKLFKKNYKEVDFNPFNHLASAKYISDTIIREEAKISRNSPCPCGSGKKYKQCCMN